MWGRRLRTIVVFLGVVAVVGVIVLLSGIVPVKASSGHWDVTRWFLSFASHRSVATHSLGVDAPSRDSLANAALILKGAGHFETGCAPCHGSPTRPPSPITAAMTPHAPPLTSAASEWEPEELFSVVKHGLKFTGMPAWPAQERDDEVWAVVAFLLTLPDLDAETYRRLVYGDEGERGGATALGFPAGGGRVPTVAATCTRCHGADGLGRGAGAFPRLAGQRPAYLYLALHAYASGNRHSGVMEPMAADLSGDEMRALARHYSRLASPAPASRATGAAVVRGEVIARQGVPAQRIPSCADCHGPSPTRRNPAYPRLAGQYADYLALQLRLFAEDHRGGSAYARLMHPTADRLSPEQVRDVALYYATLATPPTAREIVEVW